MGWLYLIAAAAFPPVFVLWRPRVPVPPGRMKVRVAAAVVVVWLLAILWAVQPSVGAGVESAAGSQPVPAVDEPAGNPAVDLSAADGSGDAALIGLFGWVPGLAYAGLLLLAREAMQVPPAVEVIDAPRRAAGPAAAGPPPRPGAGAGVGRAAGQRRPRRSPP